MTTDSNSRVWSKAEPDYDVERHRQTPYMDAIRAYSSNLKTSYMVPGHGTSLTGAGLALKGVFGEQLVRYDLPVMLEGIDLGPNAPAMQSRKLAAEAWGAHTTWFMTNGASQANRTAALAVRGLGKHVLMQRSSHSSFVDGVLAAGLHPSFVIPNVDERNGAVHGITPEMLETALTETKDPITSVYVVSPSYFGATADVAGLAEVAHRHGAALVVDAAWGAHFGFHEELPESPARLGADLVISSTHKLAGSLTQSAMLHLGHGDFVDRLAPLIERAYMMTASTSASAILMGSLDIARSAIATGREGIGESIRIANALRDRLRADSRFAVLDDTFDSFDDIVATDPLRVVVDISKLGVTGHWVSGELKERGVAPEMATVTTIVLVIGAGAQPDIEIFLAELDAVAKKAQQLKEAGADLASPAAEFPAIPAVGNLVMLPRDAYFAHTEVVPAEKAAGRISADSLAAYPPGIPNVQPGEVISPELVEFLTAVAASPTGYVRGSVDPLVTHYRVVAR